MDKHTYIQKYLHEELTDLEYEQFTQLIKSDPQFAKDLEIESVLFAKHKSLLKQEISQHSNLKEEKLQTIVSQKSSAKIIKLLRSVAAISILTLAAFYLFQVSSNDNVDVSNSTLVDSYIRTPHDPPHSLMGNDEEMDKSPWSIGIESYKQEKYELAIEQINTIPDQTNQQLLYLALSKLYINDTTGAISDFISLLQTDKKMHQDEARWFLSLTYLKSGEPDKAKPILQQIVNTNSWNSHEASSLLKRNYD